MTDYAVINPATGETLATYPTITDEALETVLEKADAAYRTCLHHRRGAGRSGRRQDRRRHGLCQRRPGGLSRTAVRRRQAIRHLARDGSPVLCPAPCRRTLPDSYPAPVDKLHF